MSAECRLLCFHGNNLCAHVVWELGVVSVVTGRHKIKSEIIICCIKGGGVSIVGETKKRTNRTKALARRVLVDGVLSSSATDQT